MAHALMPSHAGLDCGCLSDALRGLYSPLLCEHATAASLPLRAVSCLAALSDAVACRPCHAAAVLQESPPLATSHIGNASRRARLSSPAAKASQPSQGRGLHSGKRSGSAAQRAQEWASSARNASARGVDAHSSLRGFCTLAVLLLQQLLTLTCHATAIAWVWPPTTHCPSLPSTPPWWAVQTDVLSPLLPLGRSTPLPCPCPLSTAYAHCPSSALLEPLDYLLSLSMPSDVWQLPAPLRPGTDSAAIPLRCSSAGTLGCGGRVSQEVRPGYATAAQQRVLALRPSSSSLERLAGVLCCLDFSWPPGAIRRPSLRWPVHERVQQAATLHALF